MTTPTRMKRMPVEDQLHARGSVRPQGLLLHIPNDSIRTQRQRDEHQTCNERNRLCKCICMEGVTCTGKRSHAERRDGGCSREAEPADLSG